MATLVKDKSFIDINGKQILWDNTIKNVLFYSAASESWDRTGGGYASWYIENILPFDSFDDNELDSDKWSFFNYRGTVSGTISDKLFLTISGSDARGGITSAGKWKLTGDFDLRLYFDESSYYNEYRGNSATGLTVSVNESNKLRISKYFNREDVEIGYAFHYVNDFPLKYSLWTQDQFIKDAGENDITCMRLERVSGEITAFVSNGTGFTQVGSTKTGGVWSDVVDVEIELESEQFNYYSSNILGFAVSGTLTTPTEFSTPYRGPSSEFPERALLVVDTDGMSILDESNSSLWMRFQHDIDYMFKDSECQIAASNGRVYYTTASGVICLDFPKDRASWYTDSKRRETRVGISMRNFKSVFYNSGSSSFILDNDVLDIDASSVGSDDFVVVGTAGGAGMLINQTEERTEQSPEGSVRKVRLSPEGNFYWNYYDFASARGKVFYRESVQALVGVPGSTFSFTDYYSLDTTPVVLMSEYINDMQINNTEGHRVVLSHRFGVDYIVGGICTTYGPIPTTNPIIDPVFSEPLGVYWFNTMQSLFNVYDIYVTNEWSVLGSNSVRMQLASPGMVYIGNYAGVYQQVNLTGINKLYFDFRLVNTAPDSDVNYINLEVVVNGVTLVSYIDAHTTYESLNNSVDVSAYTGSCTLAFVIKSAYNGSISTYNYFYLDNIRTVPRQANYEIIPTAKHEVKEALLLYNNSEHKIFFVTEDGYGAIDADSDSLDYFIEMDSVVPASRVVSAEYVEYVDEV